MYTIVIMVISSYLSKIDELNSDLEKRFQNRIEVNRDLKRTLVSFQANKKAPGYRWYKFKEGYSASLVRYIFEKLKIESGEILDPFAGSGTSLFVAAENGIDSVGIELLPIGIEIIDIRRKLLDKSNNEKFADFLEGWLVKKPWEKEETVKQINHLKITENAFPSNTERDIEKYVSSIGRIKNDTHMKLLLFALLCVLEEVSYTRKDGQCLRWDYRANRSHIKGNFNKGVIKSFDSAISEKLNDIIHDLRGGGSLFDIIEKIDRKTGKVNIQRGSCLKILPQIENDRFDALITSPPYCNRYDYTRTYALELALLGVDEEMIKDLRQTMMSCTVENKEKNGLDKHFSQKTIEKVNQAFDNQLALQEILKYLENKKEKKELNNSGIVRMLKNYFYESSLIIFECYRVLKNGAHFVMVNDNVRYAGAHIPVDLILSDIAEQAGFSVEKIWVLPTGKGNSSQQMGVHGRQELRKCVYVWKKL